MDTTPAQTTRALDGRARVAASVRRSRRSAAACLGTKAWCCARPVRPPVEHRTGPLSRPISPIEEYLMSTSGSSWTSAQDQYLDAVREGQEAWADAVRAWSDSV
jgi:hypothetical protein